MSMGNRRLIILITLMAGLALAVVLDRQPNSSPVATTAQFNMEENYPEEGTESAPVVLAIRPRTNPSDLRNAFAVRNWTPPPAISRPATQPQTEETPPLPFAYLGKQLKAGKWVVFLSEQNQTYIAAVGDVVADTYRVERLGSQQLTMRYLPSGEIQTLSIGSGE